MRVWGAEGLWGGHQVPEGHRAIGTTLAMGDTGALWGTGALGSMAGGIHTGAREGHEGHGAVWGTWRGG